MEKRREASVEMSVTELGIDPRDMEDTGEFDYPIIPRAELLRRTLVTRARAWVGHEFGKKEKEQCAYFVRRLLAESGIWVPPAKVPFDSHLTSELEQGPGYANSFFSTKNGLLLGYADLQPGDLVAFRDTYQGDFPAGCITHVGVWVGDGSMVDRSTEGEPVRELRLDDWWKTRFVIGLRPDQLSEDSAVGYY